jgi:hypothetical protein
MSVTFQVVLALVSWFLALSTEVARLGYERRHVPKAQRGGVAIMPIWPLMPLICLSPALILGSHHLVMKCVAGFHAVLLLWAIGYISYWVVRRWRDV